MPTKSPINNETLSNATESIQPTAVLSQENLIDPSSSSFDIASIASIQAAGTAETVQSNATSQTISHKQKRSTSSSQSTQTTSPPAAISTAQIRIDATKEYNEHGVRSERRAKADKLIRNEASVGRIVIAIHNISVMNDAYNEEDFSPLT